MSIPTGHAVFALMCYIVGALLVADFFDTSDDHTAGRILFLTILQSSS